MRNDNKCVSQTRPYTQMSLKDQKWSLDAHESTSRFWERKEGEKGRKS